MRIVTLTTEYLGSNIYLIIEDGHAVAIDPSDNSIICRYKDEHSLVIDLGILTHEHCDHTYEVGLFRKSNNCQILASYICSERLMDPKKNLSSHYSALVELSNYESVSCQKAIMPFSEKADITFTDVLDFSWNNHHFFLKETPGHTAGSICILIDNKYLFTGDSLFKDDLAVLRFPGGSKSQYENKTVPWLKSLPVNTYVYPGHYTSFELGSRLSRPLV